MRRIGVRSYLFLVLSLMSAVPVVWLGTIEASRLSRLALDEADHHTREVAFDIARDAGAHLDRQVRAVNTLAAQIDPTDLANHRGSSNSSTGCSSIPVATAWSTLPTRMVSPS